MKIGIISDTHDNLPKITEAVGILNSYKIDFLIHCGDYVAPFSLIPLQKSQCDWIGVLGNNDGEKDGLRNKSEGRIKESPYFLTFSSIRIAVSHVFFDCDADIVAFGHTHQPLIQTLKKQGKKPAQLLINPGEVSGWLYGKSSLAIVDLETLVPEIIYF